MKDATVHWVGQEDASGCVAACIAMVCGKSYAEVKAELGSRNLHNDGLPYTLCDLLLAYAGFSVQRIYGREGSAWPPQPWAPIHLLAARGGVEHLVVMLADGTILDPADPAPRSVDDYLSGGKDGYFGVSWVAGIFPCAPPGNQVTSRPGPLQFIPHFQDADHRAAPPQHIDIDTGAALTSVELVERSDEHRDDLFVRRLAEHADRLAAHLEKHGRRSQCLIRSTEVQQP